MRGKTGLACSLGLAAAAVWAGGPQTAHSEGVGLDTAVTASAAAQPAGPGLELRFRTSWWAVSSDPLSTFMPVGFFLFFR